MTIRGVLLKHRPQVTIKSYTVHVHGCSCEKFTPNGEDEASWKEWATHVEDAIIEQVMR